jgi:hypothetical protein
MGSLGAPGAKAVGRYPVDNRCGNKQRKLDPEEIQPYDMSGTAVISDNVNVIYVVEKHIEMSGSMC